MNATSSEKSPRSGAPARALVKALPTSWPSASRIRSWTVPSKTLAVPEIVTVLGGQPEDGHRQPEALLEAIEQPGLLPAGALADAKPNQQVVRLEGR